MNCKLTGLILAILTCIGCDAEPPKPTNVPAERFRVLLFPVAGQAQMDAQRAVVCSLRECTLVSIGVFLSASNEQTYFDRNEFSLLPDVNGVDGQALVGELNRNLEQLSDDQTDWRRVEFSSDQLETKANSTCRLSITSRRGRTAVYDYEISLENVLNRQTFILQPWQRDAALPPLRADVPSVAIE